ncbi:CAP domain-containing protein [Streptomyces avicenniae]|uniref:CAP domain-containing protein n=1 Tax=Streptomyces avicenniae TaxID=500153 RepID=UPI00069B7225|nr:CAP domain-containing protein [Streptomyces avicenniae]
MGRHRRRRSHARTGLIGASAALAVGAVGAGSGLLPGMGGAFSPSGSPTTDDIRAQGIDPSFAGSVSPSPNGSLSPRDLSEGPGTSRGSERGPLGESASPSESATTPEAEDSPSEEEAPETTAPERTEEAAETEAAETPDRTTPPAEEETPASPAPESAAPTPREEPPAPAPDDRNAAVEAVLSRVNAERAAVGCVPVTLDPAMNALAAAYSQDMAVRGFFDHTDPEGRTPWDRAAAAGIESMGGENIARGQQDATAVMDAWMGSDGHRQNILNCDFTTMGVGVYFGDGGPWWTQVFGF